MGSAVLTVLFVVAICLLAVLVILVMRRGDGPPGADDDNSDEDGGGNDRTGPRRPVPPGDRDPEWWPRFEREFAAYVARLPVESGAGRRRGD